MSEFGLGPGRVNLRSAGPITFGPAGILFLADNAAATVFAVDVADPGPAGGSEPFDLDERRRAGRRRSWAASPATSSSGTWRSTRCRTTCTCRSSAATATRPSPCWCGSAALDGAIADVPLDDVPVAAVAIGDAPAKTTSGWTSRCRSATRARRSSSAIGRSALLRQPIRTSTVTDMAYVDGALLVAGLSNEEFSLQAAADPVPLQRRGHRQQPGDLPRLARQVGDGGADPHVRALRRRPSILASYTCTPVVHFPLADLTDGAKAVGRTVAELGAVNQPLDMVSFAQDGEEYLLVANTAHGLVKIACRDIDGQSPLTEPQRAGRRAPGDQGPAGDPPPGQPGRQLRAGPAVRRRGPSAPAFAEDRVAVAAAVTEASWSRSGGGDCIRLTGLPAGADVQVCPGTAVAAGGLPPMAGRLVRDGGRPVLRAALRVPGRYGYTVTVEGAERGRPGPPPARPGAPRPR